jgi:hypothetical protein
MVAASSHWNLPLVPTSSVYQVSLKESTVAIATFAVRFP